MNCEVKELLEAAMREGALTILEQVHIGYDTLPGQPPIEDDEWRFTGGLSTWRDIGEWLVLNAGWERHPSGEGKRQFYKEGNQ